MENVPELSTSLRNYLFALLLCISAIPGNAKEYIVYPQPGESFKKHHAYPTELLYLAVSKSDIEYEMVPSRKFMNQSRAIKQLNSGQNIRVMWTMTSKEREDILRPIRIPIYKGLIGWRVLLAREDALPNKSIWSLRQMKKLSTIQGHDWPDTSILRSNGFNVITSPTYAGIFKMVAAGRADIFPRSIIEVWDELDDRLPSNTILESNIIISYPTASYFFVAKTDELLHDVIERGLNRAISDGSFDALFNKHFKQFIDKASVKNRVHYKLNNPILPKKTPLNRKELWFSVN